MVLSNLFSQVLKKESEPKPRTVKRPRGDVAAATATESVLDAGFADPQPQISNSQPQISDLAMLNDINSEWRIAGNPSTRHGQAGFQEGADETAGAADIPGPAASSSLALELLGSAEELDQMLQALGESPHF